MGIKEINAQMQLAAKSSFWTEITTLPYQWLSLQGQVTKNWTSLWLVCLNASPRNQLIIISNSFLQGLYLPWVHAISKYFVHFWVIELLQDWNNSMRKVTKRVGFYTTISQTTWMNLMQSKMFLLLQIIWRHIFTGPVFDFSPCTKPHLFDTLLWHIWRLPKWAVRVKT